MRSVGNVYNPKPEAMPVSSSAGKRLKLETKAIEIACDIRYHRSFVLAPNPQSGRDKPIRVSYSDTGRSPQPNDDGLEQPILLWAGGMFGGRFQLQGVDEMAQSHVVRLVAVDRPGIGGTGSVPLEHRIATWLDIVPALLDRLQIQYVSLACHSAGTMFMLATLLHLRHLLHPQRPMLTMFGPWVPPQYSGRWSMNALRTFPVAVFSSWAGFAKAVHDYVGPVLGVSRTTFGAAKNATAALGRRGSAVLTPQEVKDLESQKLSDAVEHIVTKYIFAENIHGANDEALLCLGKGKTGWNGIADALERIAAAERAKRSTEEGRLRLLVFYAENDEMIGKGGAAYLNACLKRAAEGDCVQVQTFVVDRTDHNSITTPAFPATGIMMRALDGEKDFGVVDGMRACNIRP